MLNYIKNFRMDEDGAVTVDWVVLTAAIVGLGIAVLTSVGNGTMTASGNASQDIVDSATAVNFSAMGTP